MDTTDHQFRRYAVLAIIAVGIQTAGSSLAAQTPATTALQGTTWFCTAHMDAGKTRTGYMYLSPTTGVKLAETEHSSNADPAWWPRIEDVPSDLNELEEHMRWESTGDQLRIYYHADHSMYIASRAAGKMWIGAVPLEQGDPDTFFREAVCQGLLLGRAGACPSLFDYRIEDPDDKFMMCEQRAGWPR